MQNDLEAGGAQQCRSLARAFDIMSAFVDLQNMVVKTLRAHLHFGHAEVTQPFDLIRIDLVGAGFDDQSHVAVMARFIEGVNTSERSAMESAVFAGAFGFFFAERLSVQFIASKQRVMNHS
jgi:hypothetical protein